HHSNRPEAVIRRCRILAASRQHHGPRPGSGFKEQREMIARMRQLLQRVVAQFRAREYDREFEAEMAAHLEFAIEENLQRGMTPAEAQRQAMVKFGGRQQSRERQREARSFSWPDEICQDLRFTWRTLRKDSGFTAIALVILTLAIGANTVVFSV